MRAERLVAILMLFAAGSLALAFDLAPTNSMSGNIHVTNGVHIPTWLAYQMMQLYDRNFEPGWLARLSDPEIWRGI